MQSPLKKSLISLFGLILALGMMRCGPRQTTNNNPMETSESSRALLIDGEWTLNYVMNAPAAFETLYPKSPILSIDSRESSVSGFSGCNQFNGTVEVEGNSLKWGENFGVTRKMCPDMAGESLFLETLKKANRYSVTDTGKTLNLIMGDIAVMRFQRK